MTVAVHDPVSIRLPSVLSSPSFYLPLSPHLSQTQYLFGFLLYFPPLLSSTLISSPIPDLPEQWMVGAVHSPYDLDNIKMSTVDAGGVHAEYELENILLEGHCFDSGSGQPPRGLQFVLKGINEDVSTGPDVDTLVMANLGYFQLKVLASCGTWF